MKWNKLEIWLVRRIARGRPIQMNMNFTDGKLDTMHSGLIADCSYRSKK